MHRTQHLLRCAIAVMLVIGGALSLASVAGRADEPLQEANPAAVIQVATFAGGCFWCMESPFDKTDGVISTTSGYTGGRTENPSYDRVKRGRSGHIESLQVKFDSSIVRYEQLLWLFWHNVDPTQANGQFCDEGNQYRSMIFYHDEDQKQLAETSKEQVRKELGKRIRTEIVKASTFYPAEEYHQDYYKKNPTKYKFYRFTCGRDARLDAVWGGKARGP